MATPSAPNRSTNSSAFATYFPLAMIGVGTVGLATTFSMVERVQQIALGSLSLLIIGIGILKWVETGDAQPLAIATPSTPPNRPQNPPVATATNRIDPRLALSDEQFAVFLDSFKEEQKGSAEENMDTQFDEDEQPLIRRRRNHTPPSPADPKPSSPPPRPRPKVVHKIHPRSETTSPPSQMARWVEEAKAATVEWNELTKTHQQPIKTYPNPHRAKLSEAQFVSTYKPQKRNKRAPAVFDHHFNHPLPSLGSFMGCVYHWQDDLNYADTLLWRHKASALAVLYQAQTAKKVPDLIASYFPSKFVEAQLTGASPLKAFEHTAEHLQAHFTHKKREGEFFVTAVYVTLEGVFGMTIGNIAALSIPFDQKQEPKLINYLKPKSPGLGSAAFSRCKPIPFFAPLEDAALVLVTPRCLEIMSKEDIQEALIDWHQNKEIRYQHYSAAERLLSLIHFYGVTSDAPKATKQLIGINVFLPKSLV